jgi:hypothetical protein
LLPRLLEWLSRPELPSADAVRAGLSRFIPEYSGGHAEAAASKRVANE